MSIMPAYYAGAVSIGLLQHGRKGMDDQVVAQVSGYGTAHTDCASACPVVIVHATTLHKGPQGCC